MSLLVSPEQLAERCSLVQRSADLAGVEAHLAADVKRVLEHPLYVPEEKALYSRWGAHCRDDGAQLGFDPFSPHAHRCEACGRVWSTEQSHRWWVHWYQLWLAERVWLMALRAGGGDASAEARALETLALLAERYLTWPNADNVLGPGRPFFSTYLESIWVLQVAAAASLLADLGRLPAGLAGDLNERLFRPSSALIADFDEGRSNRQVWNAAALYALGHVLGDAAMRRAAAHGPSGLLASLEHGVLGDGLWYEGENYHWFALRGLGWGAAMLRETGEVDLWSAAAPLGERFRAAFRAPALTALPDFTFPARRDAKFGVSLRQRRMAELWEMALAGETYRRTGAPTDRRTDAHDGREFYASLLAHVYDSSVEARDEPWREVTEVERAAQPGGVRRGQLGWKAFLWMEPERPAAEARSWRPGTVHLEETGLAIFRREGGATYVSLDYGEPGGGHGHADRLNLTLHHGGVGWLLDFGTGSYSSPSLGWYRSTLAHNAPLLDGLAQAPARGTCVAFENAGDHGWVCALLPPDSAYDGVAVQRTIVLAPGYVLDVVQMSSETGEHQLAVPWHGQGKVSVDERGATFTRPGGGLRILLTARQPFQVLVQRAPGPGDASGAASPEQEFPIVITTGEAVTLAACLDLGAGVDEIDCADEDFIVRLTGGRVHVHRATDEGWLIEPDRGDAVTLGGLRPSDEPAAPPAGAGVVEERPAGAVCQRIERPPALDGTLNGFPADAPLRLDREDQFRRAEEPWPGPEQFAAAAFLCHDESHLYLAVDVTAPQPWFRPEGATDPELENENADIHSDGLQVYVESHGLYGWLVVPVAHDAARLRVSAVRGTDAAPEMIVRGGWRPTPDGYRVTMAVDVPGLLPSGPESEGATELGFDLYVNRGREGRERRTGQLAWSGARGARLYLAGDRPLPGPLPRVRLE